MFSFQKQQKLKSFQNCFDQNIKIVGRGMVVYYNPGTDLKIGFIVSRKIDKLATGRNRIRRRLREVFRLNKPVSSGEFIVLARYQIREMSYHEIEGDWLSVLQKIKKYDNKKTCH